MKVQQFFVLLCIVFLSFFAVATPTVFGHSLVLQQTPLPNSQLDTSPTEVVIVFNKKVEKELISIKVFDESQQEVTSNQAVLNDQQLEIRLALPELVKGVYQVQYRAISSNDGHLMEGTYHFQVATPTPSTQSTEHEHHHSTPTLETVNTTTSHHETSTLTSSTNYEWFLYYLRALYYIGFLLIIGWLFWWRFVQKYSPEVKKKFRAYRMSIQTLHLTGLISMMLMQINIFSHFDLSFTSNFLTSSSFGLMWLLSLLLSLIGFVCLFHNKWFDLIWLVFMLVFKSLNGHSVEFEPASILIITNSIHLLAASIWAAGLLFIVVFWKKHRLFVSDFLPTFTKYAFWSIVALSITGLFTTFSFLINAPLSLTPWILILLCKLLAVLAVCVIGGIIRSTLKKQQRMNNNLLIKLDFCLMLIIVILVSIFTYLNPLS